MESSDTIPLQPENCPQTKIGRRQINEGHADGIILSSVPVPPASHNLPVPLGPDNTITDCHHCHASIRTSVRHTSTTRTHMIAALCCFFGCCCCLPYCMKSTRNCDHYCPNCKTFLGTYTK